MSRRDQKWGVQANRFSGRRAAYVVYEEQTYMGEWQQPCPTKGYYACYH